LTALYAHQERMLAVALDRSILLAAEPGTGKTLVGLKVIEDFKRRGIGPALVVCPLSLIETAWMEDAARFTPDLKLVNLWHPTQKGREARLSQPADAYVVNYESWKSLRLRMYDMRFRLLVLDESSKLKNVSSAITRMMTRFAQQVPHRVLLSGTPTPNSLLELFPQMRCVRPAVLGQNYIAFRDLYFYPNRQVEVSARVRDERGRPVLDAVQGAEGVEYRERRERRTVGTDWRITEANRARLMQAVAEDVLWIAKKDCLDLPPLVDEIREFEMDAAARKAYVSIMSRNAEKYGDYNVLPGNALKDVMKVRQTTSGFLIDDDGEVHDLSRKRFSLLKEELEFLGHEQAIIFATFHWEIDRIKEMLNDLGKEYAELHGRVDPAIRPEQIRRFKCGQAQYLVAHPASCGHGQNLQNCCYAIYFSLDYSPEEFTQSRERMARPGQTRKMTCVFLRAKKTIDRRIYETLKNKGDMAVAALEELRKYQGK